MIRRSLLVVALVVVSSAALAQNNQLRRPSSNDNGDACHGDAHRFCQQVFPPQKELEPDPFKMLACLQAHRARLSRGCDEMLRSKGV